MKNARTMRRRLWQSGGALLVALSMAMTAQADVTITQKMTTGGLGGIFNTETKMETMIKGDMQCTNMEVKMKNKVLSMFGGGKPVKSTTITRLDKDLIWEITHASKTYTETPIQNMQEMMEAVGSGGMGGMMGGGSEDDGEMFDTAGVKMAPPKFSVEKTGKKEKIAGYDCEQSILTMEIEGTNEETGETFKMFLTMDMMLTDDAPGYDEYKSYNAKYAEKVGMGDTPDMMSGQSMLMAMSQYGIDADEIKEQAKKIEGFPMRTIMKMRGEGDQFTMQGGGSEEQSEEEAEEEAEQRAQAKKAMKALGGLFGGGGSKDDDEGEDEGDKDDSGSLMTMTVEVQKISTSSIKDSRFEVPSKYKKTASAYEQYGGDDDE